MAPPDLFAATKPSFSCPVWLGTDHVVIAAVCLNITPVVDAYISTHVNSHPNSYYFGHALAAAVAQGHLLMTERFLSHGLIRIDYSMTHSLECAARAGHEQLVYLLLSLPDLRWGHDAIYGAAQGGHLALLTSLLEVPRYLGTDLWA